MSLTTLPPEILDYVVANIESQPTLCNLARCSRQFYLSIIPYLYRHVMIQEEITENTKRKGRLEKLAFLIRKPDVAQLVRSFTLRIVYWPNARFQDESDSEELDEPQESKRNRSAKPCKVDQAFETLVNLLSLRGWEKHYWRGELNYSQKGHLDLLLASLLPALLNVRKIVLDSDTWFGTPFLEMVIGKVANREKPFDIRPPFEALTVFTHSDDQSKRGPTIMASLLKLPAVQAISEGLVCLMDREVGGDWNLVQLESSSSPLTSLDLADHGLDANNLGHILRAPKALKTFSYMLPGDGRLDFAVIIHALMPQENHLENISFDFGRNIDSRYIFEPIKSFIDFTTLKVFKIAAILLAYTNCGLESDSLIDIFPTSLETLHVTHFDALETLYVTQFDASCRRLPEALEHLLAQQSPQQTPSLKDLILDQTESSRRRVKPKEILYTQKTAIGRLYRVAAARDVTLDLI